MKLEREIQKEVIKYLKQRNIFHFKISERFSSGVPDLYILNGGVSMWIELKNEKGRPTQLQTHNLSEINKNGGIAVICRSKDEVIEVLRKNASG